MPEDANASPQQHRPKIARSSTGGVVRARQSPTPGGSGEQSNDGRPPTKRARKAINCEPCRNSKLKCDRSVSLLYLLLLLFTPPTEIGPAHPVSSEASPSRPLPSALQI